MKEQEHTYAKDNMEKRLFCKNKKALSGVITAVIMIALVMAAAVIVWSVVNNTIKNQIGNTEACFGNYNKVAINRYYTCYDSVSDVFQFSLSIGDIEIDSVVVAISSAGSTNSYTLTNQNQSISGLGPYPSGSGEVSLPAKNAGKTYMISGFTSSPDVIKIAPVIGGKQCEVSDTLSSIEACF